VQSVKTVAAKLDVLDRQLLRSDRQRSRERA
jgi:hypothetical protein